MDTKNMPTISPHLRLGLERDASEHIVSGDVLVAAVLLRLRLLIPPVAARAVVQPVEAVRHGRRPAQRLLLLLLGLVGLRCGKMIQIRLRCGKTA